MVARRPYEKALDAFRKLPGKATTKSFYTSHWHLQRMLLSLGHTTERIRFASWRTITQNAIVKVNPTKTGNWHWVVFDAGRPYPAAHDPRPGKRRVVRDFRGLKACGYYVAIDR